MKIVAAIPTRGVIVTECIGSVLRELSQRADEWGITLGTNKPIPACHNEVVAQALKDGADYVWLVEEDVIVPEGTLKKLLEADTDIVAADVPSRHVEGLTQIAKWKGKVYWVHTGCTLIKKEVFEKLPVPWFDNTYAYEFKVEEKEVVFNKKKLKEPEEYGGQDIHFSQTALAAGFIIKDIPVVCTHAVVKFGSKREDLHSIKKLSTITKDNAFHP